MNALVHHHRRSFYALLFFLCLHTAAGAQIKAAFTATPLSGCSPLLVYFSDVSTGNPTQWKWDLGNGVTSFLKNPSATYFNPGTYTVKLVVSNASGQDSIIKKQFITVYQSPTTAFSFDKKTGCFPLPVNFTDQSAAGSGTVTAWQWDFGDGTVSTQQNPTHTYTAAGTFNVTLRVTNSNGCTQVLTKQGAITIANGVKAAFNFTDPGACAAPASAQFTNESTGTGLLQWQWDFGDGTGSTDQNPTHTYTRNGMYSIRLVALSAQGCTDTMLKKDIFNIGSAKADFSYPAVVCVNEPVPLTNASLPLPLTAKWDFGDGTFASDTNTKKRFSKPGTYTVTLVSGFGGCSDTVQKTIKVSEKPTADFIVVKTDACRLPATVQLEAGAKGEGLQYRWDFGDSTTGTMASPLHTYTNEGVYSVRLVVTNANGCSDSLVKEKVVTIRLPHLNVSGLPKNGCVPLSITPMATVASGQSIADWQWDFGDGTTSTASEPTHRYQKAGDYDIRLMATTAAGCTDTVLFPRAVRAGNKPKALFTSTPTFVCPYQDVVFTDKSTGNVDQWLWQFGDGGTSTGQHPVHQYNDTGWQNVQLIVYSNTCPDTAFAPESVHVNPPIADFAVKNDCEEKFTKAFVDRSLGPKTWLWQFGDGTTSSEQNPVHLYKKAGTYTVGLTVTNGDCTHYTERTVMVIDEKAAFANGDIELCRNSAASFSSTGITGSFIASWQWTFGDGTMSVDTIAATHRFSKAGTFPVALTITDLLGCTNTASVKATVFGPTASFTSSAAAACLKDNKITFHDASTSDGQHAITKQVWSYGDGAVDSTAAAPFTHSYNAAGNYTISLAVEDNIGCRDTSMQPAAVIIAQPLAAFSASDTLTCTGKAIAFVNASQANSPVYSWSFGDGSHSNATDPTHAYPATGTYSIKLVVTDTYGCKDSVQKKNFVAIAFPKAKFDLTDSIGTCPPLLVQFSNASGGANSIAWDFGDGNSSKLEKPSHFYSTPGTFYAKLIATGPGGCTDTAQRKIVVKGPTGSFHYPPLTGCEPLTVNFTATTRNNASFIWDFSDGTTVRSTDSVISHTYVTAGDFVPKLILTDAGGCSIPIHGIDTIHVKTVSTSFTADAKKFCDEGSVQFSNETVSNDYITSYHWNFGDGSTSAEKTPLHRYAAPGAYTVHLAVTTQHGCTTQKLLADTINVYPSPVVEISGDSAACAPAAARFAGVVKAGDASQLKWNWDMANGEVSLLQQPLPQQYPVDGKYTISTTATDAHGCSNKAQRTLTVYPIPATNAGADQWICRGSFYQLKATGAEKYQWQASSSLSCTDCNNPLAAPADSTQYIVNGYNSFGCNRSDTVTIRVHQPFTLQVAKGDTICSGTPVRLAASGADQYTWTPALAISNPAAGITTATPQTSTRYTVTAKDNFNCFTDTGSVSIKVWSLPTVVLTNVETLPVGQSLQLTPTYSADVTSFQWSNAQTLSCATCPAPVAKPKTETTYTVLAKNDGGCLARADVTVHVICSGGNLFIPNTFSPNNDGRNDLFYPKGTGISRIKSMTVYNRWGEVVFSRTDFAANSPEAGWNGTFKGQQLSSDVYVYTCEVVCLNNEVLTYKGDIALLR